MNSRAFAACAAVAALAIGSVVTAPVAQAAPTKSAPQQVQRQKAPKVTAKKSTLQRSAVRAASTTSAASDGMRTAGRTVTMTTTEVSDPVAVAGVTWTPKSAAAEIWVRTIADGKASDWSKLERDATPSAGDQAEVASTDSTVIVGAQKVQVMALSTQSINASLEVYSSSTTPEDANVTTQSVNGPSFYSRAAWGANESISKPAEYAVVTGVMIHHTAGTNSYSSAQVPSILRGIQAYHVNSRGWRDIGYNILVDKFGRAWEGRAGGVARAVAGGHGLGVTNSRVFGLSFMGNYETARPTSAMLDKAERIIAWKFQLHGVNPYGKTWGSGGTLNAISGHRDEKSTSCPGRYVYSLMGTIRSKVASYMGSYKTNRNPVSDLTGDGNADVLAQNSGGVVLTQPFASGTPAHYSATSPTTTGTSWNTDRRLYNVGDQNGDGRSDMLRIVASGDVKLYRATASGWSVQNLTQYTTWDRARYLAGGQDWNGDGRADLLQAHSDGNLYLYQSLGGGKFRSRVKLAGGWNAYSELALVPRFVGGKTALVARKASTGVAYAWTPTGTKPLGKPVASGTATKGYSRLVGITDVTGDGVGELLGLASGGGLRMLAGTGSGSIRAAVTVKGSATLSRLVGTSTRYPTHYGLTTGGSMVRYTLRYVPATSAPKPFAALAVGGLREAVVPGDWNRDGRADLLGRTAAGTLNVYKGVGGGKFSSTPTALGDASWGRLTQIVGAPNYLGDGFPAFIGLDRAAGTITAFVGDGKGNIGPRKVVLATDAGGYERIAAVGTWDANSTPDIIARRSNGSLVMLAGNGGGRFLSKTEISASSPLASTFQGTGNVTGSGTPDLVDVTSSGALRLYPGSATSLGAPKTLKVKVPAGSRLNS